MKTEEREAIRLRLAEIEKANGGRLTPDDVVADAKNKDSPLHVHFTWDVKKAAQAYWVMQARELITSVHVIVLTEHSKVTSVFYVSDPNKKAGQQGYVSVKQLRTDKDAARAALIDEFSRVADLLRRARNLAVVLGEEAEVESLLQGAIGLRRRFSADMAKTPFDVAQRRAYD